MKILYSHYLADDHHPAVRMIDAISDGLRTLGHDVRIHRSFGEQQQAAPVPKHSAAGSEGHSAAGSERRCAAGSEGRCAAAQSGSLSSAKGKLWFAKAMYRNRAMVRRDLAAVRDFRPDVVLARQDAYCWSMPKTCWQLGTAMVTYADAPVAYETRLFSEKGRWHPPRLVEAIERWGLSRSRAVVTVSHPSARRLGCYGLDVPVHVVPNGVHPERFAELSPARRKAQREALGLSASRIIGFQGTFRPFHGTHQLRDLMLATAGRNDVQWLLIGDGPERASLEQAVAGRVEAVFLGMQPAERMGELMGLIDVAVVGMDAGQRAFTASDFYFCPLKILEFAAAGCAIVAGDQGDVPRLLDGGAAGLLVSRGDLAAWQAALNRLLDDHPLRQSLGQRARRFVLSNLTWQHTAGRVEQVLQKVPGPLPSQWGPPRHNDDEVQQPLSAGA